MTSPSETYRVALDIALTELAILLTEARVYLYSADYTLATIGTLQQFDEKTENVKAALRLYSNALRTEGRPK